MSEPLTHRPDRMERVARAMCVADGHDADQEVEGVSTDFLTPRITGAGPGVQFFGPAWQGYRNRATIFIAAFDAAG
jgi:hypothetical protein